MLCSAVSIASIPDRATIIAGQAGKCPGAPATVLVPLATARVIRIVPYTRLGCSDRADSFERTAS